MESVSIERVSGFARVRKKNRPYSKPEHLSLVDSLMQRLFWPSRTDAPLFGELTYRTFMTKPEAGHLSQRLKFYRESLGYSQEYMAKCLDISQQAYSNMERNAERITIGRMRELSKVLTIPLNVLLSEPSETETEG